MSRNQREPVDLRKLPEFQASFKLAREFYNADQKLSPTDRKKLSSAFNAPLIADPLFSLPALYAGIKAPQWLQKLGYLDKNKSTRGLSVFLGFGCLLFGGSIGSIIGYWYGDLSLSSIPSAQKIFRILLPYPPQIGRSYYGETAKDSSKIMPNPDTINWNRELIFPYNLALHIRSQNPQQSQAPPMGPRPIPGPQPVPQASSRGPSTSVNMQETNQRDEFYDGRVSEGSENDDPFQEENKQPEPQQYQSSWERIRQQNGQSGQSGQNNQSQSSPSFSNGGYGAPSAALSIPRYSHDENDQQESQVEFDHELDLERSGQGLTDDFSESEKKWT